MTQKLIFLYVYSDDPYSYDNVRTSVVVEQTTEPINYQAGLTKNWRAQIAAGKFSYGALTVFNPDTGATQLLVSERKPLKVRHELNPMAAELLASKQKTKKVGTISPHLAAMMAAEVAAVSYSNPPSGWTVEGNQDAAYWGNFATATMPVPPPAPVGPV